MRFAAKREKAEGEKALCRRRAPRLPDTFGYRRRPKLKSGTKETIMARKVVLQVDGMGCQGCVLKVTDILQAVPGVTEAVVTLLPPEAVVTFDTELTTLVKLIDSTTGSGYPLRLKEELGGE